MKNVVRIVCAVFLAVFLLIPSVALPARAANEADLRYGTGTGSDAVLTPDALFAALFPEDPPLTSAETAWLRSVNSYALSYRDQIPDSLIGRTYESETGTLTVTAAPYRYTAENGETVVWTPETVALNGGDPQPMIQSGEAYTASFGDLWHSGELELTVSFSASFRIPAAVADGLLTGAGETADRVAAEVTAYESVKSVWDAKSAAYAAYVSAQAAWNTQSGSYAAYLVARSAWENAKAEYDAYLAAKAEYDAAVAAYEENRERREAYQKALTAYFAYESQRQQNAALYDRYEAYLTALEGATSRLEILESMFLSDSHGWQFYGSLMGGTVDELLSKRDQLTGMNVSGQLIDNAILATNALRELMEEYAALRSATYENDLAKTAALFAFYHEHYTGLRDETGNLFDNIYAIYQSGAVRRAMESHPQSKPRVPHFRQFLSQLYILKCCLNDITTLDPDWRIPPGNESLQSLVEEPLFLTDRNRADPTGVTLPEEEVSLGADLPEPVPYPVKDFEELPDPRLNGEPEAVADPGPAPAPVADPGSEPTPVEAPGAEPIRPELTEAEAALLAERRNGTLPTRAAKGSEQTLVLSRRVTAHRSISNLKTVTFYQTDGTVLSTRSVEYGSEITDPPAVTTPEDNANFYTFLGWIPYGSDETEPISLANITADLSLAPLFEKRAKTYTVSWMVGGRSAVEYYQYGQIPSCPLDTARPGSVSTVYTFTGWNRSIGPVTADVTYTAQYSSSPAQYNVIWDLGDRTVSVWLPYGSTPAFSGTPTREPDGNLYEFRAWDRAVSRVTGNATYRAVWRTTPLIPDASGNACRAEHTETAVTIWTQTDVFDLTAATEYAKAAGKTLCLRRGDLELSFTPEQLNALTGALCAKLEWSAEPTGPDGGTRFRVVCRNSLGTALNAGQSFTVTARYPAVDGLYIMAYRADGEKLTELELSRYTGGRATFRIREGETVICRPEYLLQYTDELGLCNPTLLPAHAPKGAEILLVTDCAYGYEVSGATLLYASGTRETVGNRFSMPAERVQVALQVTEIVYHIVFISDGKVISEQDRKFGETVEIPEDPVRQDDEEYHYLFAGWSPYVTRATGDDRNPVYVATFSATPHLREEIRVSKWSFFGSPFFLGGVGIFLLATAGILLLVFRKKIFRKRPKTNEKPMPKT